MSKAHLRSLNTKFGNVQFEKDSILFGRDAGDCEVSFPNDKLISQKHCRIFLESGFYFVEDLSSNGTFINGDKIGKSNKRIIHDGDELSLVIRNQELAKKRQMLDTFIGYIFKEKDPSEEEEVYKDYDVGAELGSGAFASVKKATDKKTGAQVAVKIIDKKKFQLNVERKDQLEDEVKVMQKIVHPHVLGILKCYETSDYLYLILELAKGGDLFDNVANKGRYSEDEAKLLFSQLASAVGYLHDNGIAHRDLKPENILMTSDMHIKLTDFGFSKLFGKQVMKTLCGTPQYVAPEIIFASEDKIEGYSPAVDIWSMGVILYIMLAGSMPFSENSFEDIKKGKYSMEHDAFDEISDHAKDMLKRLLTVDPNKRITIPGIFQHAWMKNTKRIFGDEELDGAETPAEEEKKALKEDKLRSSPRRKASPPSSPSRNTRNQAKRNREKVNIEEVKEEDSEGEEEEAPKKKYRTRTAQATASTSGKEENNEKRRQTRSQTHESEEELKEPKRSLASRRRNKPTE